MTNKRLKQIEEIYHAASEIAPAEREAFFGKVCGDDEDLRREVKSLLAVNRIWKVMPPPNGFPTAGEF